jgi:dienelactone hydrolase
VHWVHETVSDGVVERQFELQGGSRPVPGLLWVPAEAVGPRPLLLLGHGASGTKREGYLVALARRMVRRHGFAAAAIDGPVHGDRRPDLGSNPVLTFLEFSQAWTTDPAMTDAMVADWRSTIDELEKLDEVGSGPVGYWGLSMGTILGLPLVAAEPRIAAAVLGLMGMTGPTRERIAADAPRVRCPVLFLLQWDDELFARDSSIELFGALGSSDKRLHAQPGRHGEVPSEEFEASDRFLTRHLTD